MHWRQTVNLSINPPLSPQHLLLPRTQIGAQETFEEKKNSYNQRIAKTNRGKTSQFEENPISQRLVRVPAWGGWRLRIQEPASQLSQWASQALAEASPCRVHSTVNKHLPASLSSTIHAPHKHRLSHEACSALWYSSSSKFFLCNMENDRCQSFLK